MGSTVFFCKPSPWKSFKRLDTFYDKVDEFIAYVKSTKPAPGFDEIYLPGEKARKTEAKGLRDGVEIDASTWKALTELAGELGVTELPEPL